MAETEPTVNEEHFCIAMGPDDLTASQQQDLLSSRAALLRGAKWQRGQLITISFMEGDAGLRKKVREVAETWIQPGMAYLRFDWRGSGPAMIRIAFQQGKGSWSYIGTIARRFPQSQPTMNFGWLTPDSSQDSIQRVVLHEFGHAL